MLQDLRRSDPMLQAFKKALENPKVVGRAYAPQTVKNYHWHVEHFMKYCRANDTTPQAIPRHKIQKYLKALWLEVKRKEKSSSSFLQTCTSLELFYRTVGEDLKRADQIPVLRVEVSA